MSSKISDIDVLRYLNILVTTVALIVGTFLVSTGRFNALSYGAFGYALSSGTLQFFMTRLEKTTLSRIYVLNWIFFGIVMTMGSGGFSGPMSYIFIPIPLLAIFFFNKLEIVFWMVLLCIACITMSLMDHSPQNIENIAMFFTSLACSTSVGMVLRYIHDQEFSELQKELVNREKLASIGEISAGVGHEINNPLGIALGYLRIMKRTLNEKHGRDDEIDSMIEKQKEALERISKIVKALRTFAPSYLDKNAILYAHTAIETTHQLVGEMYRKRGLEMSLDMKAEDDIIHGDPGRFQQVIMNLFSNAKDALDGTQNALIKVSTRNENDQFVLMIEDNGMGIPRASMEKIFAPFYTTKPMGKGTGMGLGISTKIVEEMQGTISVESKEGVGTTFVLSFPLGTPANSFPDKPSKSDPSRKTLSGCVLVVDDEEYIRDILKDSLERMGLEVEQAENGLIALEKVKQKKYKMVLTDITMPVMNGFTFIEEALKLPNGKTKYIVITGGIDNEYSTEERERLEELCHAFIYKPFDMNTIYEALS